MNPIDPDLDLKQDLSSGNVSLFVGSGLSTGAGLPGWYDLIAEIAARISYELPPQKWATGDALIEAAQAYINQRSLHDLIAFVKDRLDTTTVQPSAAHTALARLPVSQVFTANYDDLLERAFRAAGRRVQVVVKDSSIPFMRRDPGTVNIVKLYGDLDQPETIVLARQQYESFFLERPQMVKLLETELARTSMLYLGWSQSDPAFTQIFGELLNRYGELVHPGYAVMFEAGDDQRRELQRKQIRLVQLPEGGDRNARLAAWLGSLLPAGGPSRQPNEAKAAMPATVGAAPVVSATPGAAAQPRSILNQASAWALFAGINRYDDPHIADLHVCVNDVSSVQNLLAGKYQAARLLVSGAPDCEPNRANILGELSNLAQLAGEGDLLFFYFSGHGLAQDGESYLLPSDVRLSAMQQTAIAISDVRRIMDQSEAAARVILLDACHSGAAIGKAVPQMSEEFIRRVFEEAEGSAVLASCKQGQQSWEWPETGNSVFTHFLLEALQGKADGDGKGFVTVSDAGRYVTDGVKRWAAANGVPQTPTLQYLVAGDIVLAKYQR